MIEHYLKQFQNFKQASQPDWLAQMRRAALARFGELGYPTTKQEDWRYTSVDPLTKISFERAASDHQGGLIESDLVSRSLFYGPADTKLIFVNGHYLPELSVKNLPAGVEIGNLSQLLQEKPAWSERYLAQAASYQDRSFVAFNTAFWKDGSFLHIPKGVVLKKPIFICHYSWTKGQPIVSHPRNLILADEGSQATVVEIYVGGGDETYFTNAVTEIYAGPGAVLDHYKIQEESGKAYHIASLDVSQEADSNVSTLSVSLGSGLCRNEVNVRLDATGAECTLNGLYMTTGRQHVDNQTTIDHAKPHGTSRELYKGILGGNSSGVFNGKIIVRPDAQKTNSQQTNKNLILSKDALVNTKPLLEIFANDVKCNHGATIGRLDDNQIFYLRSRGLKEVQAKSILTYAFASELVGQIKIPSMRGALEKLMYRRLMTSELEGALS